MAVFHKDPCGVICLLMTYSAVLHADYCLVQHVIIPTLTDREVPEFFTAFKGETFHELSVSMERILKNQDVFTQSIKMIVGKCMKTFF